MKFEKSTFSSNG